MIDTQRQNESLTARSIAFEKGSNNLNGLLFLQLKLNPETKVSHGRQSLPLFLFERNFFISRLLLLHFFLISIIFTFLYLLLIMMDVFYLEIKK